MRFDTFAGNERAVETVRQMLARGNVPGALLFAGTDGVGKKTLATMLAKALVCERRGPQGDDFCGECSRCRKAEEMLVSAREDLERRREIKDSLRRVEGLIYYDLQLVEPITRFILIEQIRQLRSVAYTHPFEFPRRVFIVDQAQAVHWQAVDLLLKVLEEPPATSTIILICPNAFELRATIRSRCRQVQFVPVEVPVLERLLAEDGRVEKSRRALAARVANGSVVKARSFDWEEFSRRRAPWLEFLESLAGLSSGRQAGPDWKRLFESTRTLTEKREELEEMLRMGFLLIRDLMHIQQDEQFAGIANLDLRPRLKNWAGRLDLTQLELLKRGLDQAYRLQTRNINQQLSLDALVTQLAGENRGEPPISA
ncbi:MAG: ATP-binding protein [Deltaproteobacteria bacterium]